MRLSEQVLLRSFIDVAAPLAVHCAAAVCGHGFRRVRHAEADFDQQPGGRFWVAQWQCPNLPWRFNMSSAARTPNQAAPPHTFPFVDARQFFSRGLFTFS